MPLPRKPAYPFRNFHPSMEVIRTVVKLYLRHSLSLPNVDDLLLERGIELCLRRLGIAGIVRTVVHN